LCAVLGYIRDMGKIGKWEIVSQPNCVRAFWDFDSEMSFGPPYLLMMG